MVVLCPLGLEPAESPQSPPWVQHKQGPHGHVEHGGDHGDDDDGDHGGDGGHCDEQCLHEQLHYLPDDASC